MSDPTARVLVVDDDESLRQQLVGLLRNAGYLVDVAGDGREALEKVRSLRPDVVVTDTEMPVMDGVTLCRLIKGTEGIRSTYVIFLSGRGEASAKVKALDFGADDYVVKPADPSELKARVRSGLRLQRALNELAAKNELLERLALSDPLTGLANRRAFEESLSAEIARSYRQCRPLSLLFLDLDHFKNVNDSFGHAVGDEVLGGFAELLRRHARRGDLPARIGGEEFAVLLPHTDLAQAYTVGERIRRAVAATALGRSRGVSITVSAGAALFRGPSGDGTGFLSAADRALYRAKQAGRNCVVIEEPEVAEEL